MKPTMKNEVKTGYELLTEFIQVKTFKSSMRPNIFPLTNRAMFILNTLNSLGCKYEVDIFSDEGEDLEGYNKPKLVNIVVKFESTSGKPAIVFCAHHDIVNPDSQNCQDNSASVCNLLHLCGVIKDKELQRPVIIVFTDKEECGGIGASRMSDRLKEGFYGEFEYVVNLELTGLGGEVWADTDNIFGSFGGYGGGAGAYNFEDDEEYVPSLDRGFGFGSSFKFGSFLGLGKKDNKKPTIKRETVKEKEKETKLTERIGEVLGKDGYHRVHTPFSDACIFRDNDIDAVCIGILPKKEVESMHKETWSLCHSLSDTIDKCDKKDMENFVELLEKLI